MYHLSGETTSLMDHFSVQMLPEPSKSEPACHTGTFFLVGGFYAVKSQFSIFLVVKPVDLYEIGKGVPL